MKGYMVGSRDFRLQDLEEIERWVSSAGAARLEGPERETLRDLVSVAIEQAKLLDGDDLEGLCEQLKQASETEERLREEIGELNELFDDIREALAPVAERVGCELVRNERYTTLLSCEARVAVVEGAAARVPTLEARIAELEAQNLALILA
jgi:hypothetical protein